MSLLNELRDKKVLNSIDCHLARLLGRRFGADEDAQLLAAFISHSSQTGHSCLELAALSRLGWCRDDALLLARLSRAGQSCRAIGQPGEYLPIIRDNDSYYLHRFWHDESCIASSLQGRQAVSHHDIDVAALQERLDHYFPPGSADLDWQKVAAALALIRPLTIISGGPGTGKTSTVAKMLAILFELAPKQPMVAIAAPTGKAAMRLQESLLAAQLQLAMPTIPTQASTIHRLLGVVPGQGGFRHHAGRPLDVDLVIIDEVSMIDVGLMARLLAAIPPKARLILLGDKDQLASVKPGAVFADICGAGEPGAFSPALARLLAQATGQQVPLAKEKTGLLTDNLVELQHSYRYAATSSLGQVAAFLNRGKGREALALMEGKGDVRRLPLGKLEQGLAELVLRWYTVYLQQEEFPAIFQALECFRILTATRQGPLGVGSLNSFVEHLLARHNLLHLQDVHYHGRPIMVQRNDYSLGLFNGDVGVMRCQEDGQLLAFFPDGLGGFRSVHPARLPEHETVFAMTIHKSQGSEFDHLALVLPDQSSHEFLTRELLYTGLTRARQSVTLFAQPATLLDAVKTRVERMSGLGKKLTQREGI